METMMLTFAAANGSMTKKLLQLRGSGSSKIECRLGLQLVHHTLIFRVGPGLVLPSHLRRPYCPLFGQTVLGLICRSSYKTIKVRQRGKLRSMSGKCNIKDEY